MEHYCLIVCKMESMIQKILDCLMKASKEPKDLSIEEIAQLTGIHRNTVAKYVFALKKEGKIKETRKIGQAKMYTLA